MMVDTLNKQGFDSYWSQDTSLWIENPGYTSPELEMLGYKLCDLSKDSGMSQKYVITFWQNLKNGPNGKIINVKILYISVRTESVPDGDTVSAKANCISVSSIANA